jgi:hypothetical protein
MPVNDDGTLDAQQCIQWHRERVSKSPQQERAELDSARRRKLELEIDRLEGHSLDADEAVQVVSDMISRARARLLALGPAQAARANPNDPKRAEQAITEGIYEALTELADDPFARRRDVAPAAKVNGQRVGGRVSQAKPRVKRSTGSLAN